MQRRVNMSDIAKALGVSKNTVSLALRHDPQIPQSTRERVSRVADEMGYRANPVVSELMVRLRASQSERFKAKLAILNANNAKDALKSHPTLPEYVKGCNRRAEKLGYSIDEFWLYESGLTTERLRDILLSRGIRGIIIVGLMKTNVLPDRFSALWQEFPSVVTGVRTHHPTFSFCCVDHYSLAMEAVSKAIELGYKRPGMVLDPKIHSLVDGRFASGFHHGMESKLGKSEDCVLFDEQTSSRPSPLFTNWLKTRRPDVVLTLYNQPLHWLEQLGYSIPEHIGVIQMEWRSTRPHIAGMHQHNDLTGEAAVDTLINQIHNNERGVPGNPRATLIAATWKPGATIRTV
jgi:LacI family transcriptional regulator